MLLHRQITVAYANNPSVVGAIATTCQRWLGKSVAHYGGLAEVIRTLRESYPSKMLNLLGAALGNASPVHSPAITCDCEQGSAIGIWQLQTLFVK